MNHEPNRAASELTAHADRPKPAVVPMVRDDPVAPLGLGIAGLRPVEDVPARGEHRHIPGEPIRELQVMAQPVGSVSFPTTRRRGTIAIRRHVDDVPAERQSPAIEGDPAVHE